MTTAEITAYLFGAEVYRRFEAITAADQMTQEVGVQQLFTVDRSSFLKLGEAQWRYWVKRGLADARSEAQSGSAGTQNAQ